jgi:hypothetical protein
VASEGGQGSTVGTERWEAQAEVTTSEVGLVGKKERYVDA